MDHGVWGAVRQELPQLISTGHVQRGKLGVVIQGLDEDLAKAVGLDEVIDLHVHEVERFVIQPLENKDG